MEPSEPTLTTCLSSGEKATCRTVPEWPTSSPWVLSVGATEFAGGGVQKANPSSNDCRNYKVVECCMDPSCLPSDPHCAAPVAAVCRCGLN